MSELFNLTQTQEAIFALMVLAGMFVLFLRETFPTEVVAMGGAAVFAVHRCLEIRRRGCCFVKRGPLDDCHDVYRHGGVGAHGCAQLRDAIGRTRRQSGTPSRRLAAR